MSNWNALHFCAVAAALVLFTGSSLAQRPSNASTCDYYAQALYGANNSDTQHKLVQHIVSLAFEGGSKLQNISSDLTGILRPGKFGGVDVDLQQYFNGSRASTNVNNAPIGINWLDQGGAAPLAAFLAGENETLTFANSSNQYHLFGNFFIAFSRAFGCTLPFPPLPNNPGPVSLAYAHKFMNLDFNQLGHFINQLTQATLYFGFSAQDAETFRTSMNSRYNVRCAPAITLNPAQGPQLLSLCQNPTCPLAVPVSDCAAYVNLTAGSIPSSNPITVLATATATASVTVGPSDTATTPASTSSQSPIAPASPALSTGGIAGVAIGGAAVVVLAVVALLLFRRRHRKAPPQTPATEVSSPWDRQQMSSPAVFPTSPHANKDPHVSYYSTAQPPSEMDTSRYQSPVDPSLRMASPDMVLHRSYQQPVEIGIAPVEMDGGVAGAQPWHSGQPDQANHPGNENQWYGDGSHRYSGM